MSDHPGRRGRAALPAAALLATMLGGAIAGLAAAAPASAASNGITSPGQDGIVFTKNQTIQIKTDSSPLDLGQRQLQLAPPGQAAQTVDSGSGINSLSYNLNTSCYPSKGCSGYHPAVNGTWKATLTGSNPRTFVLAIPAQAPEDVTAQAAGPGQVNVGWRRGAEPDLVGYVISEADNPAGPSASVSANDACDSSGSCAATLNFTGTGYAGVHSFVVRAQRATCPNCTDTLLSAASDSAQATVSEPAQPSPSQLPGGSASPSPGSSPGVVPGASPGATPGTVAGASPSAGKPASPARTGTTTFGNNGKPVQLNFGANLGLANPGLPKITPPSSAAVPSAKLPPDTFSKTLGYPNQPAPQTASDKTDKSVTAARPTLVNRAADVLATDRLWRGIAGALVLVLIGAHLRRWLSSTTD